MSQIDRTGTFRGLITDKAIGLTKESSLPQAIFKLQAIELYDAENEQWLDWTPYDEVEMTGYFVLVSKSGKPTLNAEQLRKAVGWSGATFSEFEEADYSNTKVQFRIEENTYNGKTSLQVSWIDHVDADPSRSLNKLEAKELKALDAKFAKALKQFSGGPKPKPVDKPAKPKNPAKTDPTQASVDDTKTPLTVGSTPDLAETKTKPEKAKFGKPPKTKSKSETKSNEPIGVESLGLPTKATEDEAWDQMTANVHKDASENDMTETWIKAVEDFGGADSIDAENSWAAVRDIVLEILGFNKPDQNNSSD